jgi:hypothetical protein
MIETIPTYVALIFVLTTAATLLLFIWAIKKADNAATRQKWKPVLLGLTLWLVIQGVLTASNVYKTDTNSFPPKIMLLGILPTLLTIAWVFVTKKGKAFLDSLPLKELSFLHVIRIPVEVGLYCLFLNKAVPELMTFEGRNFDIVSGITAPFIAYFGWRKGKLNKPLLLLWNFICLALLLIIVVNALFSAPSPFQKFAFEQPNIAIFHFPFSWLPTFIVPIVLFSHLTLIRQLMKREV